MISANKSAYDRIKRLNDSRPHALALARLVCPAALIEPQLLRRLRRQLLPNSDVGAEADFWFSALVDSRGVDSVVLDQDVASLLRAELRQKPSQLARVLDEIEDAHRYLPETLRLEERLIRLALQGGGAALIETALRPALRTLHLGGDGARNLAQWALRALPCA
jgi:hypothetical protein